MQGRADTAGEVVSLHSQHFREDTGSSHSNPLTMAKQIQREQLFHANQYFPVLLSPGVCTQMLPLLLFAFQICGCSSSQRVKCVFPPSPHSPSPSDNCLWHQRSEVCCFHQDLGCATLHFLLTGLMKQWLYIHTES